MKKLGCEMCHAPHLKDTKFVYVFKEQIKLCMECYKSWNIFFHNNSNYNGIVTKDEVRHKIWIEWIFLREGELKREKVSFT